MLQSWFRMAASSGLAFSSSSLVRLHGGALVTISRRSSLIQRREVGFDGDVSLKSLPSSSSSVSALERLNTSAAADRYTRERSSIVVIGLSVHSTPVETREKLAIVESEWPRAIEELCKLHHIEEAAVLSTCNRMEIYVLALSQHRGVLEVTDWMSKSSGVPVSEICKHRVLLYNKDAVEHLFEVSSGLDSLVLGEGQILSQVKQVAKVGQGVVGFGRIISALFKKAITVGKRVRSETSIAAGAMSVSSAAVELALMKLSESSSSSSLAMARILVVGAGKMGKLVIQHLVAKGCKKMMVVNRSEEAVAAIVKEIKEGIEIIYKPLSEMYDCAAEVDLVFTCTASETPLFLKRDVEKLRPGLRLFIDISVPRNVGSCVDRLGTARVYNVDDLKQVVEANKEDRQREVVKARVIIDEETKDFQDWRDSLATVPTVKKLRALMEIHRVSGLEKCLSKVGDDITKKQRKAIEDYGWYMFNMLLRGPMQHLRCDGTDNRFLKQILENMHALIRMFNLEIDHGDDFSDPPALSWELFLYREEEEGCCCAVLTTVFSAFLRILTSTCH